MPLTRPLSVEEDITMSMDTMIRGLVAKYNTGNPPAVGAKDLLGSILLNCTLNINALIEQTPFTFAEKAAIRGDLKTVVGRALRVKLSVVGAQGQELESPEDENPNIK
jgi:hypothetical protein